MSATPTTSASDLPVRASSPCAAGGVRTSPSTTTVLVVELGVEPGAPDVLVVLTAGAMLVVGLSVVVGVVGDVVVGLSVVGGVVGLTDGVVVLVVVVVGPGDVVVGLSVVGGVVGLTDGVVVLVVVVGRGVTRGVVVLVVVVVGPVDGGGVGWHSCSPPTMLSTLRPGTRRSSWRKHSGGGAVIVHS
jgi:hypothetical protein